MKRYKKQLILLTLSCVIFVGCTIFERVENPQTSGSTMEMIVFGLGRADSFLIITENHTLMIDTGENQQGRAIVAYLEVQGITRLDYLIITHFDRDHVGGAHRIIDAVDVGTVILPNYSRTTNHVERMQNAMATADIQPLILTSDLQLTLDDVSFIINPADQPYFTFDTADDLDELQNDDESTPNSNNFSIIVAITHGENAFLFTGDAQSRRMREILTNAQLMHIDFDFLKVPRHGRYMGRSREFITTINPRYAVITDSNERPVDAEMLAVLNEIEAQIFFARSTGVHIISDGDTINIQYRDFFAETE